MDEFKNQIDDEWKRQTAELEKPNVMIVGGTGVGKSSLINYIFGDQLARIGSGKPVTRGMHRYEHKDIPVVLFDTEGYEISSEGVDASNFRSRILPKIDEYQKKDLKDQIHLAWYCISISNNRITEFDIDNINIISKKLPGQCCIVFTQCDNDEENSDGKGVKAESFKRVLRGDNIHLNIFETSVNEEIELSLDFEELIEWSSESLPEESLRHSFIASQQRSIRAKCQMAQKYVIGLTGTASITGLSPIPFSDAFLLSGQQMAMAIKIASIFGISSMGERVKDLLKTQLASALGRSIATSLTKFIPFLGSVINAVVAGTITYGLGYALIKTFEKACNDYLESGTEPDWAKMFTDDVLWREAKEGMKKWKKYSKTDKKKVAN